MFTWLTHLDVWTVTSESSLIVPKACYVLCKRISVTAVGDRHYFVALEQRRKLRLRGVSNRPSDPRKVAAGTEHCTDYPALHCAAPL